MQPKRLPVHRVRTPAAANDLGPHLPLRVVFLRGFAEKRTKSISRSGRAGGRGIVERNCRCGTYGCGKLGTRRVDSFGGSQERSSREYRARSFNACNKPTAVTAYFVQQVDISHHDSCTSPTRLNSSQTFGRGDRQSNG